MMMAVMNLQPLDDGLDFKSTIAIQISNRLAKNRPFEGIKEPTIYSLKLILKIKKIKNIHSFNFETIYHGFGDCFISSLNLFKLI